jgi:hypothetical protein
MQNRKSTYKGLIYDWQALQENFADETQCYELSGKQIALLMYPFRQAFWATRWENQPENFGEIEQFVNDTLHILYSGEQCSPIAPSGGGGGGLYMPACITTEDQGDKFVINIEECCDMTVIINIKDCCCDDSSGGGGNNITGQGAFGASGGSNGGGWTTEPQTITPYSGVISGCEVLTGGVVDFILNDQQDMLEGGANSGGVITNIIDFFATYNPLGLITSDGVDWLTDQATETFENAASLWNDQLFRNTAKEAWAKTFGDRQSWKLITRSELLQWAGNIPKIWYVGVYPIAARATMQGLIRLQNMPRINQQLALSYGECDQEDYTYYLAGAGVPYLPPTSQASLPAPGTGFLYEWAIQFDFLTSEDDWTQSTGTGAAWIENLGWHRYSTANTVDYFIFLKADMATHLTGISVFLDVPMAGTLNAIKLGDVANQGQYLDDTASGENPIHRELDADIPDDVHLTLQEFSYTGNDADDTEVYIEKIILYGTGTPPNIGTLL